MQSRRRDEHVTTPQTAVVATRPQPALEQRSATAVSLVKTKSVKAELESVQSMVNQVRQEFQARSLMCQRLEASITSKTNQLHDLRKQLSEIGGSSASLKSHLDFYEAKYKSLADEFDALRNEISLNLIDEMKNFELIVSSGMNYMDESQSDYHCIERHVAYVREVIKGQIEQLLNAKEDHLQNLSLCDKYKSESEQLRLEIQTATLILHDRTSELKLLDDDHASLLDESTTIDYDVQKVSSERASLEQSISAKSQELETLRNNYSEASRLYKVKFDVLKKEESDLEGQIQALQEEKLDRQHQQDILVLLFDKAKRDRDEFIGCIEELDASLRAMENELDSAKCGEHALNEEERRLAFEMETLQIKLREEKNLEADFLTEKEQVQILLREIAQLSESEAELKAVLISMESELSSKLQAMDCSTSEANAREQEWTSKLTELTSKNRDLQNEVERLRIESAELSSLIEADKLILSTQEDEILRCREEMALVTVAIDDATRRVEQQSDAANELKKLGASIKDDEKEIKRLRLVLQKCKADAARHDSFVGDFKVAIDKEIESNSTAKEIETLKIKLHELRRETLEKQQAPTKDREQHGCKHSEGKMAISMKHAENSRLDMERKMGKGLGDFDSLLEDYDAPIALKPVASVKKKERPALSEVNSPTMKTAMASDSANKLKLLQGRVGVTKHPSGPISSLKFAKENIPIQQATGYNESADEIIAPSASPITYGKSSAIPRSAKGLGYGRMGLTSTSASGGDDHAARKQPLVEMTKSYNSKTKTKLVSDWFFDDDDGFSFTK